MQINLRQQADAILQAKRELSVECIKALSAETLQEVFHELYVHQAELELQNEELRQTQIELGAVKTRYFELYDLAPVGYLTISENGLITQANFAAATMLGLPRRALVKMPFSNFIDHDEQSSYYLFCKQFVESKEQQTLNLRMLNHDGAPFWAHLEAVTAQNIDGIFENRFILIDTSKLMQAEKALLESKQDFQVLFQNSPIGTAYGKMLYDTSGKPVDYQFLDVNEAYKKLSGIDPQSNPIEQIFPGNEKHSVDWIGTFAHVAQTGEQIHIAHSFQSGNHWYDCIAYQFKIGQFVVMLVDVTDRMKNEQNQRQLAEQIKLAAAHLVTSQEQVRRRLSSELHDRTSPNLAAINVNLNIIATELPQEHSTDVAERIEDTLALIADTAASISEICANMRPPLLDYAGLAAAMRSYSQQFALRTGIAVQFDCINPNARYTAELESLLFRIFQEALTNCLKHAQATSVIVTLSNGNHPIALTITDNGVGFNPALLGKNGHAGSGLLSMREMAEVINGKFFVESAPGKGTRIVVEFCSD